MPVAPQQRSWVSAEHGFGAIAVNEARVQENAPDAIEFGLPSKGFAINNVQRSVSSQAVLHAVVISRSLLPATFSSAFIS